MPAATFRSGRRTQHEAMTDRFSLARILAQCWNESFGDAHVGLWEINRSMSFQNAKIIIPTRSTNPNLLCR